MYTWSTHKYTVQSKPKWTKLQTDVFKLFPDMSNLIDKNALGHPPPPLHRSMF